jgi:hypothetical protein
VSASLTSVYQLRKNWRYQVRRDFADFYNNRFSQGEVLTFIEYHFLPYHGGYTIVFQERTLYLQEEVNANILNSLGNYLSPLTE